MDSDYESLGREVHVHSVQVARFDTMTLGHLRKLLDAVEQERLGRLLTTARQAEYMVAHGMLRTLLGQYLKLDPLELRFTANAYGKPALTSPFGTEIQFNLAHTNDRVLIAVTRGRQVGVDIEYLAPHLPDPSIYVSLFTEDERLALAALSPLLAQRGFYTAWTRKEAFIKATGKGFSADLLAFSVTVDPRLPPQLTVSTAGESRWNVHDLDIATDYTAALVVSGPFDYCVRCLEPFASVYR